MASRRARIIVVGYAVVNGGVVIWPPSDEKSDAHHWTSILASPGSTTHASMHCVVAVGPRLVDEGGRIPNTAWVRGDADATPHDPSTADSLTLRKMR